MPTVAREPPFRIYFWSNENQTEIRPEPPHVHVSCSDGEAEFWLNPEAQDISLKDDGGLGRRDLKQAESLARSYRQQAIRKWNEHFGSSFPESS